MFLSLVGEGFSEDEVLDMPLNKAYLCLEGAKRRIAYRRQEAFTDLVHGIGIAFSGKGFDEHIAAIGKTT